MSVKVLQFSSRSSDNCGVGKYEENFMDIYKNESDEIETKFFEYSPYQTRLMDQNELDGVLDKLRQELKNYDILHIQHEFGLYSGTEFAQLVDTAKDMGKKVVITVHLSPDLAFKFKPRGGIGPRSIIHVLRQRRLHKIFKQRHIEPYQKADLVVSHNNGTTNSLVKYGITREHILQFNHPVLDTIQPEVTSTEIAEALHKNEGDVIYATVGFLHKYKGTEDAVRALKFLPDNYKLAIIGGMQPISNEVSFYNKITTLVDELNLKERVYITGFVQDDDRLNALIRETDICVYPYDNVYYGQVSSGALNLAFSNERAVVAYPTDGFKDINGEFKHIVLCGTFAYYELARELKRINVSEQLERIHQYADKYSWPKTSQVLLDAYNKLVTK
jgi:glycosyltransferase involved in cell wall biosynthesis